MRRHLVLVLVAGGVLLQACNDGPQEPALGALRVSVATIGGDLDLDGYTVAVDGGSPLRVPIDGAIVVPGLATGSHDVALGDVAANCTVAGPNPTAVSVARNDTAQVAYGIACVATGVRITMATTGLDLDPDGYTVSLDGATPVPLPLNGSLTISRLAAGSHVLTLGGMAVNCTAVGTSPLSLDVPVGEIVAVGVTVACVATSGVVEVTAATSGLDLDANGYLVQVDGGSAVAVAVNGTLRVAVPAGDHEVTLAGAVDNCAIADPNPRTLHVDMGGVVRDTARTTFAVSCVAVSGVVEVTASTSGVDFDSDGYHLSLDGGPSQVVAVNGVVRFNGVSAGDHQVSLGDAAPNCAVTGANPRALSVTVGGLTRDTARTTFTLACEPTTGTARIITVTSGTDLDPDGYWMAIDYYDYYGYPYYFFAEQMAVDDTVLVTDVPTGDHTFDLHHVTPNCAVAGANPRTVRVTGNAVTDVIFAVSCVAPGSLAVTAATTGVDPDPNGYTVRVAGPSMDRTVDVAPNGAVTVSGMVPGAYTVTLGAVAPNCAVTGQNPRAVTVASGGTTLVAFAITCAPARQLALVSRADGNDEIYVVKSNGAGLMRLTSNPAADNDPAWSPDGSRIAFTSERDGNREIYVMSADGSAPVRRTSVPALDYAPAWSPDGSKIAFTSERDGNHEIYMMNADGSAQVRLTSDAAADHGPAWSPNGDRIAFASRRDGTDEIYVMNADGSNVLRLSTTGENSGPAWSPDGLQIVFHHGQCYYSCDYDLFRMNASGSGVLQLTSGDPPADTDADWSRDGQWIAFATVSCDYYQGCYYSAIAAVKPSGADRTEVLSGPVFQPVWRP